MKVLTRTLSLVTIAALALFFVNCGGDGNETPAEKTQLAKFTKAWVLVDANSAKLNGNNAEQINSNFEITFTGTYGSSSPYTYTVKGTDDQSPWPATDTWEFVGNVSGTSGIIQRGEDGIGIAYTFSSNGNLNLSFQFDDTQGYPGSAKVGSVTGQWSFDLKPKP